MNKTITAIILWALTCASAFSQTAIKKFPKPLQLDYRIDDMRIVEQTPCMIRFAVAYYIKPTLNDTFFIGAYIPSQSSQGNFAFVPAGRSGASVPKGAVGLDRNITVDAFYKGTSPSTTDQIEVVIYKSGTNLKKRTFSLTKTWKRFEIQGMKRIYTSSNHIKAQVQYFIDPTYAPACFISANVPNCTSPNTSFSNIPAGRLPNGVPKGQKHFSDNIVFEVLYHG